MPNKKKWKKIAYILLGISIFFFLVFIIWMLFFEGQMIFRENEEKAVIAAKKYYELNSIRLPKEVNEVSTVTLDILYQKQWAEDIYIPKTTTLCDSNKSFVKVKKESEDEYSYYAYLKCGKYESTTDHLGPVISLNGEDTITIAKNSTYEELGVKKVFDETDGNIDISNVKIDNSKVDATKIGEYEVTYTVLDSFNNKTIKKRKVIVEQKLDQIIKENTNQTGIYQGMVENNYLQFSGMLFRIVKLNSDNTVKIVTDENISSVNYGTLPYEESNIYKWLNEYFYEHINSKDYLIKALWCTDQTEDSNVKRTTCNNSVENYVGLLTIDEFNQSINNGTYLDNEFSFVFPNKLNNGNVWVRDNSKTFITFASGRLTNLRPSLVLKSDLKVVDGDGTINNPYKLDDYNYANANTPLSERITGEFVNYSGYLFRIIEIEENDNIKIIMESTLQGENGNLLRETYKNDNNKFIYNVEEKHNLGYIMNQDLIKFLSLKKIVSGQFSTSYYVPEFYYDKLEKITYEAKIAIPDTYEMFSAKSTTEIKGNYWLRNASSLDGKVLIVSSLGTALEVNYNSFKNNGIRVVTRLSKDSQIVSGKGLRNDPYYIK